MKNQRPLPYRISSITQQHELLGLLGPEHPLVSVIDFAQGGAITTEMTGKFTTDFYTITLKQQCTNKTLYGQQFYDFDQGMLSFIAPGQVLFWEADSTLPTTGWMLVVHPDFMRHHTLGQRIKEYNFFHYAVNEALHLSPREEKRIERLLRSIRREYRAPLDAFSQPVLLAQLELLLHYANRFYHRQFLTRQQANTDLLARFATVVADYVNGATLQEQGLPTVRYVAEQLHLSPAYLSDLLKKATGLSAQQHVHQALIEKAKELLVASRLSVSEIAYRLGFEHSQSFSKLFKQKTLLTPLAFRQSFD